MALLVWAGTTSAPTMAAPMDASSIARCGPTSFALPARGCRSGCTRSSESRPPCSAPRRSRRRRMASTSAHHSRDSREKEKSSHNDGGCCERVKARRAVCDVRSVAIPRAASRTREPVCAAWSQWPASLPSGRVSSASEDSATLASVRRLADFRARADSVEFRIVPGPVFGLVFEDCESRAFVLLACVEREDATAAVSRTRRFMAGRARYTRGLFWREFIAPR